MCVGRARRVVRASRSAVAEGTLDIMGHEGRGNKIDLKRVLIRWWMRISVSEVAVLQFANGVTMNARASAQLQTGAQRTRRWVYGRRWRQAVGVPEFGRQIPAPGSVSGRQILAQPYGCTNYLY